ncbi:hypothetical protein QTP88_027687 [Uroleucon formosanum]
MGSQTTGVTTHCSGWRQKFRFSLGVVGALLLLSNQTAAAIEVLSEGSREDIFHIRSTHTIRND